ncbi:oligosaccharide flippase family protein [Nocardioides insulae]|uniref:oligosaccharide flippase family protein n=1 Tax=Nocardioides insulae TaxID=394734 RepID=UPI0004065F34|nr:oligosaccharide flippase family protein [Nocardioides insulae]
MVETAGSGRPGRALVWSFANTALARLGTLAISVALARLLGPAEFGTYAVALVALMAVLSFNELGVSLAIVRWPDDPARIAPTVATISVAMSAVLTAMAIWAAPWFTGMMGDPAATLPVQLLSLCVLVNGLVATPAALMQRAFRQDQRLVADQVNTWVGALVSIALAAAGLGALALVVGRLAGAALSGLLFWHYSPLPYRFGLDRELARRLLAFGVPLAGASMVVFAVGFLDQLVVGRVLGPASLGAYVLAVNLAAWPVTLLSLPLRAVAPALFARMQHDPARMHRAYGQVQRPLAAVALPGCVAIAACAPQLVAVVYGEAWSAAGPVLRWLALFAALRIGFELCYDYLVVLGRTRAVLRVQLAGLVALVPAVWLGLREASLAGAGAALVAVAVGVTLPLYLVELRRAGLGPGPVLSAWAAPAVAAVPAAGVPLALTAAGSSDLAVLLVGGTFSAALAAALLRWRRGDLAVWRLQDGTDERTEPVPAADPR